MNRSITLSNGNVVFERAAKRIAHIRGVELYNNKFSFTYTFFCGEMNNNMGAWVIGEEAVKSDYEKLVAFCRMCNRPSVARGLINWIKERVKWTH